MADVVLALARPGASSPVPEQDDRVLEPGEPMARVHVHRSPSLGTAQVERKHVPPFLRKKLPVPPKLTLAELEALAKWKLQRGAAFYRWKEAWASVPSFRERTTPGLSARAFHRQRKATKKEGLPWPY
ncbi:hypothetical protein DACRYDRAFT_25462 [Dacryopinax primogenitus]|uniref:Uncharacterized protein n=1 Tax=Dacryopinax primogenitus (strain DJM 731) TaxID=1858805 RepID=M5FU54_DACPD|nr:uncharacterized protein DACRYDRAFT_25462 [Dacryopinax primogenitus]EJT96761.1 hypothetical protein DACRYDRAFT_25462 [Dacryopinax primogenitus]